MNLLTARIVSESMKKSAPAAARLAPSGAPAARARDTAAMPMAAILHRHIPRRKVDGGQNDAGRSRGGVDGDGRLEVAREVGRERGEYGRPVNREGQRDASRRPDDGAAVREESQHVEHVSEEEADEAAEEAEVAVHDLVDLEEYLSRGNSRFTRAGEVKMKNRRRGTSPAEHSRSPRETHRAMSLRTGSADHMCLSGFHLDPHMRDKTNQIGRALSAQRTGSGTLLRIVKYAAGAKIELATAAIVLVLLQ